MKFKFSLEKVLKHRNIQADLAQKDFLEAQAHLNAETKNLENMIQLKNDSIAQRASHIKHSQTWTESVAQINQFVTGQDLRIKRQNLRLTEIEKLVEAKREILRLALTEVKIIDKLREKKYEEYIREEAKKEQNELDELATLRFSRIESLIKGSHEDGI